MENNDCERTPFEPNEASKVIGPVEFGNPSSHGGGGVKLAPTGAVDNALAPTTTDEARRIEDTQRRTLKEIE